MNDFKICFIMCDNVNIRFVPIFIYKIYDMSEVVVWILLKNLPNFECVLCQ